MKNQYFGDINDYKKYGLIRAILDSTQLRTLVAWMLTPDDGSNDGNITDYLNAPAKWSSHDPELFHGMKALVEGDTPRRVSQIQDSNLLPDAGFYSEVVHDQGATRNAWSRSLLEASQGYDLVFLDPDNGIEVKSRPYGLKNSSKFVYWREIEALWRAGHSLLIYQHFPRENREQYIQRMLTSLKTHTPRAFVEAFSTSHVVFLMALQSGHRDNHQRIVKAVGKRWRGQIAHRWKHDAG